MSKTNKFIEELDYTLNKFDWGKSNLDARAITFLNTWKTIFYTERDAYHKDKVENVKTIETSIDTREMDAFKTGWENFRKELLKT